MRVIVYTSPDSGTAAVLMGHQVHILKYSASRYHLTVDGVRRQYCCQDGCCDGGLKPDVSALVARAKSDGAKEVILRTGRRGYYIDTIDDLPVKDVGGLVGVVAENILIDDGGPQGEYRRSLYRPGK